jgi:hypothetical protein
MVYLARLFLPIRGCLHLNSILEETSDELRGSFSRRVVSRLIRVTGWWGGGGQGGDRLPARDKQLVTLAQTEGWGLPLDVCRENGHFMSVPG